jgi:hypothetical protein
MNLGSNGCLMTDAALKSGHYKTYIICSVGHMRLDLVGLLVLCIVAYNDQGTGIVLQVIQDNANFTENW